MNRLMGDSIGVNADRIPASVEMVAGYDTGTVDIVWDEHDWALFPGKLQVHIDQGYGSTRATEAHALVFDVETGAFSPDQAAELISINTSPRPTIYVNRSNMVATIASAQHASNWRGDVWLAFPGWSGSASELPKLPAGCHYVAIQDQYNSTYNLSTVLDDTWPTVPLAQIPVTFGLRAEIAVTRIKAAGFTVSTTPLRNPEDTYVSTGSHPEGGTWVKPGSHVTLGVKLES